MKNMVRLAKKILSKSTCSREVEYAIMDELGLTVGNEEKNLISKVNKTVLTIGKQENIGMEFFWGKKKGNLSENEAIKSVLGKLEDGMNGSELTIDVSYVSAAADITNEFKTIGKRSYIIDSIAYQVITGSMFSLGEKMDALTWTVGGSPEKKGKYNIEKLVKECQQTMYKFKNYEIEGIVEIIDDKTFDNKNKFYILLYVSGKTVGVIELEFKITPINADIETLVIIPTFKEIALKNSNKGTYVLNDDDESMNDIETLKDTMEFYAYDDDMSESRVIDTIDNIIDGLKSVNSEITNGYYDEFVEKYPTYFSTYDKTMDELRAKLTEVIPGKYITMLENLDKAIKLNN